MLDSCGTSGTGETPQERSDEEAHRPPRGKRASWSGNQPLYRNNVYERVTIVSKKLSGKL